MISAIDFPTENDQNFNDDLKVTEVKVSSGKLLLYDKGKYMSGCLMIILKKRNMT
jgi:hypothetical protein